MTTQHTTRLTHSIHTTYTHLTCTYISLVTHFIHTYPKYHCCDIARAGHLYMLLVILYY